jgi:hypothetical protein
MEEWARIPPQQRERLINNYRKCSVGVIAVKKVAQPVIECKGAITFSHGSIGYCTTFLNKIN